MEFQGGSIAAIWGLNKWKKRLSAPDMVHMDGEKFAAWCCGGILGWHQASLEMHVPCRWTGEFSSVSFPGLEGTVVPAHLLHVSDRTSAQHRLSSELSAGEGRHSKWCFCFLLLNRERSR